MRKQNGSIIIYLFLAVLIAGMIALVYLVGKETVFKSKATSEGPTLTLSEQVSATAGVPLNIDLTVMPDGQEVYGVDMVATFDKDSLTLTDVILRSTILDLSFPQKENAFDKEKVIQTASEKGVIEFGLLCWQSGNCKKGLDTSQNIATLVFTPLKNQGSQVFLSFNPLDKTNTTDSNLIGVLGTDILNTVKNATVTIGTLTDPPTPTTSIPTPTTSQENVRDAQRHSDLRIIQSALEQYHSDLGVYPAQIPLVGGTLTSATGRPNPETGLKTYLNTIPDDPDKTPYIIAPGNVGAGVYRYRVYKYLEKPTDCDNISTMCTSYVLCANFEIPPTEVPSTPVQVACRVGGIDNCIPGIACNDGVSPP